MPRRPISPPNESTVDLHFPLCGVDISQSYDQQPNKPLPSGLGYARTSPLAINVRAYEPGTGRARGGSRRGANKYINSVVFGNASIQCLADVTITSGTVPGSASALSPLYAAVQSVSPSAGTVLEYNPLTNIQAYTPVAPPYFLTATAFVTNATSGASNGQGAGSDGSQTNPSLSGIANGTPVVQAFVVSPSNQFLYIASGLVTTALTTLPNSTLIVNSSISVCTSVNLQATASVVMGTQTNGTIFSIGIDQAGNQLWSNFSQGMSFAGSPTSTWSVTDNTFVYSIATAGQRILQTSPTTGSLAATPILTTTTQLAAAFPGYLVQADVAEGGPAYQSIAVASGTGQLAVCMLTPFSQLNRSQRATLALISTGLAGRGSFTYQPASGNTIAVANSAGIPTGFADSNGDFFQCSCWDTNGFAYVAVTQGPPSVVNVAVYKINTLGTVIWTKTIPVIAPSLCNGIATDGTNLFVAAFTANASVKTKVYKLACADGSGFNSLWYTSAGDNPWVATAANILSVVSGVLAVGTNVSTIELVNTASATLANTVTTSTSFVLDICNDGTNFYAASRHATTNSYVTCFTPSGSTLYIADLSTSNGHLSSICWNSGSNLLGVSYYQAQNSITIQTLTPSTGAIVASANPFNQGWYTIRGAPDGGFILGTFYSVSATTNMLGLKSDLATAVFGGAFWPNTTFNLLGFSVNQLGSVGGQLLPTDNFPSFSLPGMTAPIGSRVCSDGTDFYMHIPLFSTNVAGVARGVVIKISGTTGATLWTSQDSPLIGYVPSSQSQPTIAYVPGSPSLIQVSGGGAGSLCMLASSGAFAGEGLGALTQNTVGCAILTGSFTSSVPTGMSSKAQDVLVAVSAGTVAVAFAGTWSVVGGGTSVLNTTATVIRAAQLQGKLYFVDGVAWWDYNPASNAMEAWTATAGSLPTGPTGALPRLIATHRGSLMLAGWPDDPRNWAMSATNNARDWNFFPVPIVVTQAINGTNSQLGQVGDVVTCLIQYSDDVFIFGGDHTIYMMQGDPRIGGQMALITDTVGMAFGSPWARDPYGNVYFVSNLMGIYVFQPGSGNEPERISQQIEQFLQVLNPATTIFNMLWDDQDQGLHLYCTSSLGINVPATHFFWEQRTGGWMVDQYPNFMNPKCVFKYAGNSPADRVALIGSWDGYVRSLTGQTSSDDGNTIVSQVVIGPILSKDLDDILLKDIQGVLGMNSGQVVYSVYVGPTAEIALNSAPVAQGVWMMGRNPATYIRRAGHAIYVKITASNYWSMEAIRCRIAGLGKVRQRSPR